MTWLAWRQFRANAALAVVATTAVTVVLVLTRDHVAGVDDPEELSTVYTSLRLLGTALVGWPALVGAFWGAPLLARELESGTHRLAWTQSVTRRRWLATKLTVVGVVAVIVTAVFSLVFTWWSLPFDQFGNRIGTANFGQRGITPVAYALFALVLGTIAGAVLRRTLPAMAATLLGFFVVRFSFQWLVRPHLVTPVVASRPSNEFGIQEVSSAASGAWVLSSETLDAAGHVIHDTAYAGEFGHEMARVCGITIDSDSTQAERIACINDLGLRDVVKIHPADHFWALQAWEAASFLGLAAILAAACFWWIRHRTA